MQKVYICTLYIVLILNFDAHENNFNSYKDLVQGNVSNFVLRIVYSHSYIWYFMPEFPCAHPSWFTYDPINPRLNK